MNSFLKVKRHRDTETALETIIQNFSQKSRNTNSIKSCGGAISQMLESESSEAVTDKR